MGEERKGHTCVKELSYLPHNTESRIKTSYLCYSKYLVSVGSLGFNKQLVKPINREMFYKPLVFKPSQLAILVWRNSEVQQAS